MCCLDASQGLSGNTMLGVGHVVTTSVGMCDIDIRPVSVNFCLVIFTKPQKNKLMTSFRNDYNKFDNEKNTQFVIPHFLKTCMYSL